MIKVSNNRVQPTDFSVQADVTSIDPSNTNAGVGGLSATMPLHSSGLEEEWKFLYGDTLDIEGLTGFITEMNLSDLGELSLSADSILRSLQAVQTVEPYQGTIRNCINHIISSVLVGAPISYDTSVPTGSGTVVPAFRGSVWVLLRDFMSVYRLELAVRQDGRIWFSAIGSSDVIYDLRNTTVRPLSQTESVVADKVAKQVEVEYYNNQYVVSGTAYPVRDEEPSVISVSAGEVAVVRLTTLTGLRTVNQPTAVDWLDGSFTGEGTNGRYTIAGDDGLPVKASAWVAAGGSVRAEIDPEDPYTIILTVTSPSTGVLAVDDDRNTAAPYHLAMTDGQLYPRLFITGTGVRTYPETLTLDTGANDPTVEPGVGYTLTNPFVGSLSQAYDVGLRLSQSYAGAESSVSRGSPFYEDFTSVQGSTFVTEDANFRIDAASYSPGGVNFNASNFSLFKDFDSKWVGKTFAQFDTFWLNQPKRRMRDFSIAPLRVE